MWNSISNSVSNNKNRVKHCQGVRVKDNTKNQNNNNLNTQGVVSLVAGKEWLATTITRTEVKLKQQKYLWSSVTGQEGLRAQIHPSCFAHAQPSHVDDADDADDDDDEDEDDEKDYDLDDDNQDIYIKYR